MKKIIVSDTGPLIALAKINQLELLTSSFAEIHIPKAVFIEATTKRHRLDAQRIESFITKHAILHEDRRDSKYHIFGNLLDEGESQALSLASELQCAVLIDERLGRKIARQHSIPIVGVMGVLLRAKETGEIDAILPLTEDLLSHGYRLSKRVLKIVLTKAGEL